MPKVKKSVSKYQPLDQLLKMDFTQLRALECEGGGVVLPMKQLKYLLIIYLSFFLNLTGHPQIKRK